MYAKFQKKILVSGLALAMIAMGDVVVADTVSQDVSDARKERKRRFGQRSH